MERVKFAFYSPLPKKANRAAKAIVKSARNSGIEYSGPINNPPKNVDGYEIHICLVLLHDIEHHRFKEFYNRYDTSAIHSSEAVHLEIAYNSDPDSPWDDEDLTKLFSSAVLQESVEDSNKNKERADSTVAKTDEEVTQTESVQSELSDSKKHRADSNEGEGKPITELRKKAVADSQEEIDSDDLNTPDRVRYSRSQKVREYVLRRADGECEGCGEPAPFESKTGEPYLHAHHIYELSNSGQDSPQTVIALCPNCHYHVHHGQDGEEYNERLISKLEKIERRD